MAVLMVDTHTSQLTWHPTALVHYPLIEHVHVAPGGDKVLYTVRTAYLGEDASEFRDQVFVASLQGEARPQPLTQGAGASSPKWSPDDRWIAFLRRLPGSEYQGLWLMAAAGGEAWPLAPPAGENQARHESIVQFEWRPDSRAIAFISVPTDEERELRRRQRDDARQWRVDYDFAHLYLVEFDDGLDDLSPQSTNACPSQWRQLTRGRLHVECLAWHPHGHALAFIAQDTPYIDSWPSSRLMTLRVDSAPESELVPTIVSHIAAWKTSLAYSPDGNWIATQRGIEGNRWPYAGRMHIFAAGTSRSELPRPLADVSDAQPGLIGWTPDSQAVVVRNDRGLGTEALALPIDGTPAYTLVAGDEPFAVAHINQAGVLAMVRQHYHAVNSVDVIELGQSPAAEGARPRRVVTPCAPGYPAGPLPQVQELQWTTDDNFDIDGILYLPAGYDAASGQKLPLLLHIHGGPMGMFQRAYAGLPYYYTPASLCELGFAVLRCNPRGSSGYGKAFRFANLLDWGGGDYRDLMQGVDTVIQMGIADPDRLGVCGWSYGGFMTSWIITQTHRFQVASIGAPVTNAMSFCATSDIPSFVPDFYGGEAWEAADRYRERSPIFHAHKARTPALIQHGATDERVPLEQGLQYYYVLARNEVPVELYIYPRQGHAILEPRLLIDAMQRNLAWFAQHLGQLDESAREIASPALLQRTEE